MAVSVSVPMVLSVRVGVVVVKVTAVHVIPAGSVLVRVIGLTKQAG
jgi:hypothetical protein